MKKTDKRAVKKAPEFRNKAKHIPKKKEVQKGWINRKPGPRSGKIKHETRMD